MTTTPGLSEKELAETFDIWQLNMLNCCNFELTFLPIEETKMLVLLPDGIYLRIVRSYLIFILGSKVYHHDKYTILLKYTITRGKYTTIWEKYTILRNFDISYKKLKLYHHWGVKFAIVMMTNESASLIGTFSLMIVYFR